MFFIEKFLKTLLLGVLLSSAGSDYTSETSDIAVVSTTAGNSGVLGDLIEGPEAQCSVSQKSFVTESFYFGQNCSHFIDEPSLQCFPNLERVQPLVVLHNVSGNSKDGKEFNLTVKSENGWQFRETSTIQNSRFSFLKGRIAIAENIKYLLELDAIHKALLLLVFLLCFIWKYRTLLLSGLKVITKVYSKRTVPCAAAMVKKIQLSNSNNDTGISKTASEKSSFTENDAKLPERSSVNHGKTASFLNDLTISSVENDSASSDSSDDDFPDEHLLARCENGCIYFRHMLKKGPTNVLQTKDWKVNNLVDDGIKPVTSPNDQHKITNDVQMNDLPLTSSSSADQGTSSHTLENNTTDLFELKDLKGDGDSSVAPLGDQDDKTTENENSLPEDLMGDVEDIANDKDTNPGEIRNQKFVVQSVEATCSSFECEESTTNLARMKNWKLDNLSFDDCPNSTTDDADKAMVIKDLRFDEYIDSDESYENDEDEFPDEFFLFCNPDDKTKNFISTKDLYPDDIVGYDEDEEEFPDEFFLFANPDDKTKTFIATKDLYPEDLVSYDDVTNSQNADVMLLGDQSDVVTESSEDSLNCDEDVVDNTEDRGQDDPGREMNSVNGLTLLFLSVAFVLPCLILRSS